MVNVYDKFCPTDSVPAAGGTMYLKKSKKRMGIYSIRDDGSVIGFTLRFWEWMLDVIKVDADGELRWVIKMWLYSGVRESGSIVTCKALVVWRDCAGKLRHRHGPGWVNGVVAMRLRWTD